jgi:glycine/D-amino acid oxidase-like deaminating enzyme
MLATERFEPISGWIRTPPEMQEPLVSDLRADVAVVGGGITGLSSALHLREAGADVIVVERDFAGSGASGRNAGVLTGAIVQDVELTRFLLGEEWMGARLRFADAGVAAAERMMETYKIDCEYNRAGHVLASVHPRQDASLLRRVEQTGKFGAPVRLLSKDEMRERGLPRAFTAAAIEQRGGLFDPGKYVLGLRRAALEAGVRIFEQSSVIELKEGATVAVRTGQGSVSADFAVLATNAYTPALPWRRRLVVPIRVSQFETGPLEDAQLGELAWHGREPIGTVHHVPENYGLTPRQTIVGGTKAVTYPWRSDTSEGYDRRVFRILERTFRDRFPTLRAVPIVRFWSGWIGLTTDFNPVFGVEGEHQNVVYGLGYAGHGVAQATLMGSVIADRIQGREHPLEHAVCRRVRSWPPEPLRWTGANMIQAAFRVMDNRIDRAALRAGVEEGD